MTDKGCDFGILMKSCGGEKPVDLGAVQGMSMCQAVAEAIYSKNTSNCLKCEVKKKLL